MRSEGVSSQKELLQSLLSLAWVVEARDPYTGGHLWRVSQVSGMVARALGLDERTVARIALGGFLHDLGKIGIPDQILGKPGKLTDEESDVIKTHPTIGSRLLVNHPLNTLAMDAVFLHHETPDGKGYPLGLSRDSIPIDARVVGIADAFDAMTNSRPYRTRIPIDEALAAIRGNLGKQFDGEAGEAFLRLGEQGAFMGIVGHSEPLIPLQICMYCGPTIVVTRDHHSGDAAFCRVCGHGAKLERTSDGAVNLHPFTRKGTAKELEANVDLGLIQDLVQQVFNPALPKS